MSIIKLSKLPKYKKFQLVEKEGYKVQEFEGSRKCYIVGADNYIDNYFESIDEVLIMLSDKLLQKGYVIKT